MEAKVKVALEALIHVYGDSEQIATDVIAPGLIQVFDSDQPFMEKVAAMDGVFDEEPRFDELREYVFDLLLINFFTTDVEKLEADYLESPEWERSEERRVGKEGRFRRLRENSEETGTRKEQREI